MSNYHVEFVDKFVAAPTDGALSLSPAPGPGLRAGSDADGARDWIVALGLRAEGQSGEGQTWRILLAQNRRAMGVGAIDVRSVLVAKSNIVL